MFKLYLATAKVIHFNRFDNRMKNYMLFFLFFTPFFSFAQVTESFFDGNFTQNPAWLGIESNFKVNQAFQLQSSAQVASTSYLFTSSQAIENTVWECKLRLDYPTSSSNYACVYIISNACKLENGLKGYFVQVGGTNDEVSLYLQEGTQKIKIIDGVDKRTDGKSLEISLKVNRDSLSVFRLYSKLPSEAEYMFEGETQNSKVLKSKYFGLSYTNTSTTGNCYYFDDIQVTGSKVNDLIPPELNNLEIKNPDKLNFQFSEPVDCSDLKIKIDGEFVRILHQQIAENMETVQIEVDWEFQTSKRYVIEVFGLKDEAGNLLLKNKRTVGVKESICPGDVVFNEVMFHHADSSAEYIEFYNRSEKVIDLSGMIFTTRKSDGSLNSGIKIPVNSWMFPKEYLAFTSDTTAVINHHTCPDGVNLIQTDWNTLNNESATLILTNSNKDTIFDEFSYQESMHHVLVKNPKGVALERVYAELPTPDLRNWHSAASSHNYGTPGFINSQHRNTDVSIDEQEKNFYFENQVFSPDNDGDNDVCVLYFKLPNAGHIINIAILTPGGEKVYDLAKQFLSGQQGFFTWDGRNQKGKVSNIGVYVFYVEFFHPETGKRKNSKLPIVLTSR